MDLEREEEAPTDSLRLVVRELSCFAVIPVKSEASVTAHIARVHVKRTAELLTEILASPRPSSDVRLRQR